MDHEAEGKLPVDQDQNEIYYRFTGAGDETLVCIHGGPGQGQSYLKVLEQLHVENLRLLFYDQVGSGKSDPGKNVKWGVDRFVEELETIRKSLNLGRIHIFGHSWGGMLAMQYAIDYGPNVKSLILSNTSSNMTEIDAAIQRLQAALPAKHYQTMLKAMNGRKVPSGELKDAKLEFNARHLRRETPFEIENSKRRFMELFPDTSEAYGPSFRGLWGEDPFNCGCVPCNGPLLEWNATEKIQNINVPTLILCGLYDEISLDLHAKLAEKISDNEFVIFGNSSHFITHEKEVDLYMAVIERFLTRIVKTHHHDE